MTKLEIIENKIKELKIYKEYLLNFKMYYKLNETNKKKLLKK